MPAVLPALAIALASATLVACGSSDEEQAESVAQSTPAPIPGEEIHVPPRFKRGRDVLLDYGCLGCHRLAGHGNAGPGSDLSRIGARLQRPAIQQWLINPRSPMPSFAGLMEKDPRGFQELVAFLASLK